MRHRKRTAKLGRSPAHRKALLRNMVTSLLEHERIQTTHAKARELRRTAERMITLGKRGGLHARRRALRVIRSRDVAAKVFDDLAARYRDRPGGYTRVLKLGNRVGDGAPLSIIELVEAGPAEAQKPEKPGRGAKAAAKPEKAQKAARRKPTAKAGAQEKARSRRKAKPKPEKVAKAAKPKQAAKAKKSSAGASKSKQKATSKAGRKKTSRKKSS